MQELQHRLIAYLRLIDELAMAGVWDGYEGDRRGDAVDHLLRALLRSCSAQCMKYLKFSTHAGELTEDTHIRRAPNVKVEHLANI